MSRSRFFELKATDLAGRIGILETKTSKIITPALLPVIHPVRQMIPCSEIRSMGYEAVMTNAYTTFKRLRERASEGIHKIIEFDGTIMTDSGGYQVLEYGSVEVDPLEMARFEEQIGSDIAIILDKPTGLKVTRNFASRTVEDTLDSAKRTLQSLTRGDMIWTLPIQGGRYLDLVAKSAKESSKLNFGCFALGSPVEVMEEYDFSLLVRMIQTSKNHLPPERPFHLFGAGHPLIIPLAVALGCDMFDSASYILYARNDRYISSTGTIRLEQLEYLPCSCRVCASLTAREIKEMNKEERTATIGRHNLYALKQVMEETKQAIWEGRLWEFAKTKCAGHPLAHKAFKLAISTRTANLEVGTPGLKDRGIFVFDETDFLRPELTRHSKRIASLDLRGKHRLIIVPETKTKPFLKSDLFEEILKLVDIKESFIACASPIFGLTPAEISDVFPISQITHSLSNYPENDPILNRNNWSRVDVLLLRRGSTDVTSNWIENEIKNYTMRRRRRGKNDRINTRFVISRTYKSFKRRLRSRID